MKWALALGILLIGCEKEARAYADPGAGALLWQILVSGFVGALFYLRKFTRRSRKDDKAVH